MTTNATIAARYGARLLALVLTWAGGVLGVAGAHFAELTHEGALIALAGIVGVWLLHVLTTYADDGKLPDDPPAGGVAPAAPPAPPTEGIAIAGEVLTAAAPTPVVINNYYGVPPPPPPAP